MKNINIILFDDFSRENLLPLTFTRPVADIRVGILTIREKWEKALGFDTSTLTVNYLQKKFPIIIAENNIIINGSILPDVELMRQVLKLKINEAIIDKKNLLAANLNKNKLKDFSIEKIISSSKKIKPISNYEKINHTWDIFMKNGLALDDDFKLLTKKRKSQKISKTNQLLGNNIFVEHGAKIECAILNSQTGPIYIGKNSEIMEGAIIRGPFSLGESSILKIGSKIYGPTTIGPHSKVGGELNNSVIFGYSNKAHDGFLGNSVIGEWCNIGADSNNSNLKNNYAEVKLWNYHLDTFVNSGLQFCGLIMGDHSKCGINTMFNTGTVVGVSCNIYGAGFPRNFIPDFSWGGAVGFSTFQLEKAIESNQKMMERRNLKLHLTEREILAHVFTLTEKYRR